MPTIDEILKSIGVEDTEKTASAYNDQDLEQKAKEMGLIDDNQQEKVASGGNMNLHDFYEIHFGEGAEKVASAEVHPETEQAYYEEGSDLEKTAAAEEALGEYARHHFDQGLSGRLMSYAIKLAEDGALDPDSKATQSAQAGTGLIPSGNVVDNSVHVEANVQHEADKAIDTSPELYSLEGAAVEKARIVKAIAAGEPGDLNNTTNTVKGNMEMPTSQADA